MLATLFFDLLLSLLIYLCINGLIFNFFYVPVVSTYYHVMTIIRLLRKQHNLWWRTLVEIIYHFFLAICGVKPHTSFCCLGLLAFCPLSEPPIVGLLVSPRVSLATMISRCWLPRVAIATRDSTAMR